MRKRLLFLALFILLVSGKIIAQKITGTVVDAQKEPIPGVSVIVKGTSSGTVTDGQGNFELNVPNASAQTLVFSFLGYKTHERAIGNNTNFNIVMEEDTKQLEDVVVIGYGTQKKSLVTGAIAQVTSRDMDNKQITRLDNALQGLTAGVTVTQSSGIPGSSPNVYVRGITSINNSDPVYVVDGTVLNGGIDYLNPNDIATIEVLKDAASGAIYGTRAGNGVIIITTKKGAINSPMHVEYNMQLGIQGPISKVNVANATQYAELRNESAINNGGTPPFPNASIFGTGTNWQNEIFSNDAPYQNHSLSVSGGSDKATYFLSLGYIGQAGIIAPKTNYSNSFSLTANTSYKIGKYVTVGENLSYTYRKNSNNGITPNTEFGGPLSSALNLDPITPVYVDEATTQAQTQYNNPYILMNPKNGMYYAISPYVNDEMTNPVANIYQMSLTGQYNWSDNLIGNAYIDIHPITGLSYRSQINVKKAFWGDEGFTPYYYLDATVNNVNQTSQWRNMNQNLSWNWDNTVTYEKKINLNSFSVMVGMSALKQPASMYVGTTYNGMPVSTWQESSFNWGAAGGQVNELGHASDGQDYALTSYFGRVNYNYDERYLFSGIIRRDGSTKFGSNNRWGTFPSAQLGWVVTREKFFPHDTFLDNLKIRLSYGVVGNDMSLSDFQYESIIQGNGAKNIILGNNALATGMSPSAPANPNLKWEQTASFDAGFDAILLKNFTLTFDYYNKQTNGMLMQVQVPGFAGYTDNPWQNVGNMVNKGVEFDAGYQKNFGKDFRLNVHGNISYNNNEITYLGNGVDYLTPGPTFQNVQYPLTRMAVGHSVGAFYGFKELGTFKSWSEIESYGYTAADGTWQLYQPKAQPGDLKFWKNPDNPDDGGQGPIGQGDRTFTGDAVPHWIYGININFSYKNLDLLVFGQGVGGNQIFQGYRRLDLVHANYPIEALNAWTPLNPDSNYPRLSDSDNNNNYSNPSNFYLQSGAYFRLKTLQVGYTLPKSWTDAIGLQRVRIYGSITNLFTLTKYTGFDPEVGGHLGAGANGQNAGNYGIDNGIFPQARTFIIGLNVGI